MTGRAPSVPCTPRTNAAAIVPTRYGSSPNVSVIRPHRGSWATSHSGPSAWPIPRSAMSSPIESAMASTISGSQVAAWPSASGNNVAPRTFTPQSTSSLTSTGMPRRRRVAERALHEVHALCCDTGRLGRRGDRPRAPPEPRGGEVGVGYPGPLCERAPDLRRLLLERHPREQVLDAVLHRARTIAMQRLVRGHRVWYTWHVTVRQGRAPRTEDG